MDWEPTEPSISFVIRLWREETAVGPEGAIWRGHVTHVPSGERHYFQDMASLDGVFESYLQPNMSIFSFDEPVDEPEDVEGEAARPVAPPTPPTPPFVPIPLPATFAALALAPALTSVLTDLLDALQQATGLGPSSPVGSLPAADVSLLSVEEKVVGLGSFRGQERRGGFGPIALKGGRLQAGVQFDVLADSPAELAAQALAVHASLLGTRGRLLPPPTPNSSLVNAIFLKMKASSSTAPEEIDSPAGWRKSMIYDVLYEYHYEDADGAEGLIARIPVHADLETEASPERETSTVTDALARWDQNAAPALELRGPASAQRLRALVFVPGTAPAGSVALLRTVAGATAPPAAFTDVADFLEAIADPGPGSPGLNARLLFPTLEDFLDALSADTSTLTLGDWDEDTLPDTYTPHSLELERPVRLRRSVDRLFVSYDPDSANPHFDAPGVVYVRFE
jgi:hypothetical protein